MRRSPYHPRPSTPLGVFTVSGAGAVVSSYFNLLADTRVVGRQPSAGSRSYYHTDLLGSTRAVVQGATVTESYDYDPWGVLMPARSLGSGTKEKFTTKERDAESQLDYFGARGRMPRRLGGGPRSIRRWQPIRRRSGIHTDM